MMYYCPNCKKETEVDIIEDGFFTYSLSSNGNLIRGNFFPSRQQVCYLHKMW